VPTDPAARLAFFDSQAQEILHNYGRGRAVVAVDAGVGGGDFAAALVEAMQRAGHSVVSASIDDFVSTPSTPSIPSDAQEAGRLYFAERYDYARFRRDLIDPFRRGDSGGADEVLVVFGPFLSRAELRGVFNYTIFLETPVLAPDESTQRALDLYTGVAGPRFAATAIVDTTDPEVPRRVFADSC
jgi:uridine kinase